MHDKTGSEPLDNVEAAAAPTKAQMDEGECVVNASSNRHFEAVLARSSMRRTVLRSGAGLAALLAAPFTGLEAWAHEGPPTKPTSRTTTGRQSSGAKRQLQLGFPAVAKNLEDRVTVPPGYEVRLLHCVGDPLAPHLSPWSDTGLESSDSYELRVGDCHDGAYFFGMRSGRYQADCSDHGLLCTNHEYVAAHAIHPEGRSPGSARRVEEVVKEINAHGASVVEIRRKGLHFEMVIGSRFNRRITSATEMALAGPAAGSALLSTRFSPQGMRTRGMNNNCANGYTPWGTYLTCEENFTNVISRATDDDAKRSAKEVLALRRYGLPQNRKSPYHWDSAGSDDLFARWSASVTQASAGEDYRNIANAFGWVVEIDPFSPTSMPVKHTALGRFAHEGAWPARAVPGQPIVIYMGDDARNEYIYKFVSDARWDPKDTNKGHAAGLKYLAAGTLYVARFEVDGTGTWLPLRFGQQGLDAQCPLYPFADQADVLVHARLAADHLGATKMDRPEWGCVNPLNGEVYMTLTNNSSRVAADAALTHETLHADAANPRAYVEDKQGEAKKGNPNGHVIRWREDGADVTRFAWDIFLFGARASAPSEVNLSGLDESNDFSSPDGIHFDAQGILWLQTDDSAYTDVSNCMLLAAIPGEVGDGGAARAAGGMSTYVGARARSGNADTTTGPAVRRFLVGPRGSEITGVTMTPDCRTLFVNIQHPGEGLAADFKQRKFGSAWPANQFGSGSGQARPRSATIMVTRKDGGRVGGA